MDLNVATYTVEDQLQKKGKIQLKNPKSEKSEVGTMIPNRQREIWNTTKSGNGRTVTGNRENPPVKK